MQLLPPPIRVQIGRWKGIPRPLRAEPLKTDISLGQVRHLIPTLPTDIMRRADEVKPWFDEADKADMESKGFVDDEINQYEIL